jgi:hypothetical protein
MGNPFSRTIREPTEMNCTDPSIPGHVNYVTSGGSTNESDSAIFHRLFDLEADDYTPQVNLVATNLPHQQTSPGGINHQPTVPSCLVLGNEPTSKPTSRLEQTTNCKQYHTHIDDPTSSVRTSNVGSSDTGEGSN